MMVRRSDEPEVVLVPAHSLLGHPWWRALHQAIIRSYQSKEVQAFPPTWTRLNAEPDVAAQEFLQELKDDGQLAVVLLGDTPVACGGIRRFQDSFKATRMRHDPNGLGATEGQPLPGTAVEDLTQPIVATAADLSLPESGKDWGISCFCVLPEHRHRGLGRKLLQSLAVFVKARGARRLLADWVVEETSEYWRKLGFVVIPGTNHVLRKGYTPTPGLAGLPRDIHLCTGALEL